MWDVEAWGLRGDPLPLPLPPLRAMQVSELERFVQWNADPRARDIGTPAMFPAPAPLETGSPSKPPRSLPLAPAVAHRAP